MLRVSHFSKADSLTSPTITPESVDSTYELGQCFTFDTVTSAHTHPPTKPDTDWLLSALIEVLASFNWLFDGM